MDCSPPGSSVHRDSSGKDTGAGCHTLLQGVFLTQGSNPHLTFSALAGGFYITRGTREAHNIVLASAIYQQELVMSIHMSSPSWTCLPPPTPSHPSRLSQSTGFELPVWHSKFHWLSDFTYENVYISMLLPQFIPCFQPPLLLCVSFLFLFERLLKIFTLIAVEMVEEGPWNVN